MLRANKGRAVVREWFEERRSGGIIIPANNDSPFKTGIVQDINIVGITSTGPCVGDKVHFADRTGAKIRFEGIDYLIMDIDDILCFERDENGTNG